MLDRVHGSDVTTTIKTKHYANIFWVDLKKKIYIVSLKDFENFSWFIEDIFQFEIAKIASLKT